jgi:hypothetical protein
MAKTLSTDVPLRLILVAQSVADCADFPDADLRRVSHESLLSALELVRQGETRTRQFRARLEALLDGSRTCAFCGRAIAGRSDRVYCGATCRKKANREAHQASRL